MYINGYECCKYIHSTLGCPQIQYLDSRHTTPQPINEQCARNNNIQCVGTWTSQPHDSPALPEVHLNGFWLHMILQYCKDIRHKGKIRVNNQIHKQVDKHVRKQIYRDKKLQEEYTDFSPSSSFTLTSQTDLQVKHDKPSDMMA